MLEFQDKVELKRGNPDAFKLLFLLLYPRSKGYCRLFIRDNNLIEDIIQESFIVFWERRNLIDIEKTVESYLFVIVRNRCLNELRKQKLEGGKINIEDIKIAELQYLYQIDFTDKEEKSLEEMLIECFQKSVNELPGKMQTVFIKCKIEGKNQKEIAKDLGISIKMVEKHISKAKKIIRTKMLGKFPYLVILISLFFD